MRNNIIDLTEHRISNQYKHFYDCSNVNWVLNEYEGVIKTTRSVEKEMRVGYMKLLSNAINFIGGGELDGG
ncbi:hypothetical protein [Cytobacillus praedii]|uniref:Uncharacterized protein n=1 Tax=Cytobacillus praedii TaxID=1742358 RepID=A0A4R1AU74_9BACI|nr:hypothetical protein [Cytobacillus praedii]TCJ00476.1 hypothetical protein E0Y62_26705 [Cytobacillus praedii]